VLDRLPHHARETRCADRIGFDPKTVGRGATLEFRRVDGKPQREVGENLFDVSWQPPPARLDRSGAGKPVIRVFTRPWRPRQLNGRSQKTTGRTAAREEGAVGAASEEHSPLPLLFSLPFGAAGVN